MNPGRDEQGSSTIEVVLLMGLALLLVLGFANLSVNMLIKGVAHSAVDQGVRAGARQDVDSVPTCEDRARQVMANVLSGPAGVGATLACSDDGELVRATVSITLPSWLPLVRDMDIDVTGQARKEQAP